MDKVRGLLKSYINAIPDSLLAADLFGDFLRCSCQIIVDGLYLPQIIIICTKNFLQQSARKILAKLKCFLIYL